MWDNIFAIFILNLGIVLLVCLFFLIPFFLHFPYILLIIYIIGGIVLFNFYLGILFRYTLEISDYKKGGFRFILECIRQSWKLSFVSSINMIMLLAILIYALPYYFSGDSIISVVFGTILFWVWLTVFTAGFYFFPVSFRLKQKIFKTIQTCFFLLFDNIAGTVSMLFIFILLLPISLIFFFLFPGPATVVLWINVCIKIRLYKYDYLKVNPRANRKKIPWKELILEDNEKIGKRTLKRMIFPWK